ncbi:uncharacterized protein BDZ99DRAFT_472211 [Mytilinidion resinicola]|uniref:Uncharacterized protein n=1 Tax=Mytilinidion resinicola TaxID=574789 RepID=A0A6A6Z292_9PEZI|nr:uncharacterized protein BDZ99DRAFT_472211 [Mytilinidion resinicola]KAF2814839.1 hypothetical protein BDZ99DRAFT_472211 [Mytilinidion resinicola]
MIRTAATPSKSSHQRLFAEKVQDVQCKNDVLDEIRDLARKKREGKWARLIPAQDIIAIIYNGAAGSCPGRRLIIDFFAHRNISKFLGTEDYNTYPAEFLWDVIVRLHQVRPSALEDPTEKNDKSSYHEPVDDESKSINEDKQGDQSKSVNGASK